jgi:hypothetical protein
MKGRHQIADYNINKRKWHMAQAKVNQDTFLAFSKRLIISTKGSKQ